jgi:hypothetical protein
VPNDPLWWFKNVDVEVGRRAPSLADGLAVVLAEVGYGLEVLQQALPTNALASCRRLVAVSLAQKLDKKDCLGVGDLAA